ncbi:Gag-Pol polyprotein [Labeo rohita]|uniref:ribonuclease H n=1 Tax=Labeo rohita TaxID=84645 RepID=A0ABQ8LT48_LABRO|nr:Gag-Pol polyprotein [Labeo rohita]
MILMILVRSASENSTQQPHFRIRSVSTASLSPSERFVRGLLSLRRGEPLRPHCDRGARVSSCLRDKRHGKRPSLFRSPQIVMTPPSLKRASAAFLQCEPRTRVLLFFATETKSATSGRSSRDNRAFEELLEVVSHSVARLKLDWPQEQENPRHSKLDDRFLLGGQGERPQRRSLPFFPDLHDELSSSWSKPYPSCIFVEETLTGYLSPGSSSSLKKPALPTKPCRLTSSLVGKAFQAAGQAGAALHTMGVLQAYQADLLKDLSMGGSISEEAFLELRRATDLSFRATKQTARSIGRSMAAMVAAERHLWLNLTGIKDRDKIFLLDAPVSSSGLFGDSVNTVVTRFREAKRHAEAFDQFLPCRGQASGLSAIQPRPSQVPLRRESQKQSVASRATPRKDWGAARHTQQPSKRPDRRSIIKAKKKRPLYYLHQRGAAVSGEMLHARLPPAIFQDTVHLTSPQISEVSKLVPLSEKLEAWKLRPDISPWVVRTVEKGYRIQFAYRPPRFSGVVSTSVKPERAHLLTQELQTLLDKGAIERVPLPDRETGYYSRYFLIQSGDWFVTVDLKDAYFYVEILPQHRKFLRFAFGGEAYQYRVLPFGLALSPRTYTKCMDAALAPLRLQGIRILNYIDDWLILARSQELALRHRDVVLAHLRSLGLRLNAKNNVFGGCMGLDHNAGTTVSCAGRIQSKHPKECQARSESYSSLLSKSFRSHGSCIHGDTFGPSAHETVSVVAQSQGISSKGQSPEANKGYVPGALYPFYVVQTPVSDFGSHSRSVLLSQDANDRRFPHGLGCGLKWPSSPKDLERSSSQLAH